MHGTPSEPCVAAFEAHPADVGARAENELEAAILPLDDLEHAWLFQVRTDDASGVSGVAYRWVSCRFDPAAEVPASVYQAQGTLVPRW